MAAFGEYPYTKCNKPMGKGYTVSTSTARSRGALAAPAAALAPPSADLPDLPSGPSPSEIRELRRAQRMEEEIKARTLTAQVDPRSLAMEQEAKARSIKAQAARATLAGAFAGAPMSKTMDRQADVESFAGAAFGGTVRFRAYERLADLPPKARRAGDPAYRLLVRSFPSKAARDAWVAASPRPAGSAFPVGARQAATKAQLREQATFATLLVDNAALNPGKLTRWQFGAVSYGEPAEFRFRAGAAFGSTTRLMPSRVKQRFNARKWGNPRAWGGLSGAQVLRLRSFATPGSVGWISINRIPNVTEEVLIGRGALTFSYGDGKLRITPEGRRMYEAAVMEAKEKGYGDYFGASVAPRGVRASRSPMRDSTRLVTGNSGNVVDARTVYADNAEDAAWKGALSYRGDLGRRAQMLRSSPAVVKGSRGKEAVLQRASALSESMRRLQRGEIHAYAVPAAGPTIDNMKPHKVFMVAAPGFGGVSYGEPAEFRFRAGTAFGGAVKLYATSRKLAANYAKPPAGAPRGGTWVILRNGARPRYFHPDLPGWHPNIPYLPYAKERPSFGGKGKARGPVKDDAYYFAQGQHGWYASVALNPYKRGSWQAQAWTDGYNDAAARNPNEVAPGGTRGGSPFGGKVQRVKEVVWSRTHGHAQIVDKTHGPEPWNTTVHSNYAVKIPKAAYDRIMRGAGTEVAAYNRLLASSYPKVPWDSNKGGPASTFGGNEYGLTYRDWLLAANFGRKNPWYADTATRKAWRNSEDPSEWAAFPDNRAVMAQSLKRMGTRR